MKNSRITALALFLVHFLCSGCSSGLMDLKLSARLEEPLPGAGDTALGCAQEFPPLVGVDFLAADSVERHFIEIQENGSPPGGWVLENHELSALPGGPYQHLMSRCPFRNFELDFSWVIAPAGNSGVKYLVDPVRGPVGLEYQILDDEKHPDAGKGAHRQSAALYDLYPPVATKKINPPGQLNKSRIVVTGNHVEHWLNGQRVLQFERGSSDFLERVQRSKFKKFAGFGEQLDGRILIQHHSDVVTFKEFKVTNTNTEAESN